MNSPIAQFLSEINSTEKAFDFCHQRGLIRPPNRPPDCTLVGCVRQMNLVKSSSHKQDGQVWRCPAHKGRKMTIRAKSFFHRSNLHLSDVLLLGYLWAYETPVTVASVQCGVDDNTAIQWYQYFRDVCSWWLLNNPIYLGGIGHVVQIDESLMSKAKYHRGRHVAERWVFGMYDPDERFGILEFVDDRSSATLLPIIQEHCLPGSEIHSDQWAAYTGNGGIVGLPVNPPFTHLTVNHSENFVDPITGCHTNNVENFWKNAKRKFKSMCGTNSEMVSSHLDEFMYRQFHGKKGMPLFDNLLLHISQWYNPLA